MWLLGRRVGGGCTQVYLFASNFVNGKASWVVVMVCGHILGMTRRLQVCHRLPETCNVAGLSVLSVAASSPWQSVRARPWKSTSRCAPGGDRSHRLPWLQLFHGLNSMVLEPAHSCPAASGASGSIEKRAQESREGAVKLKEMAIGFSGEHFTMHLPVLILASEMIRCWYHLSTYTSFFLGNVFFG